MTAITFRHGAGARRLACGALGLTLAGGLAACGSSSPEAVPPATTVGPTTTAPASTTTTVAPVTTTVVSPPPTPATTTAPPTTAAGPGPCATSQLTATLGSPNGTAGSTAFTLSLLNKSQSACTLAGFPGVSFVGGGNGTQVGAPAVRNGAAGVALLVEPGHAGQAVLLVAETGNYTPATCAAVATQGFRVYPPDETASLFVAQPGTACSNPAESQLQVGGLVPGPAGGGIGPTS